MNQTGYCPQGAQISVYFSMCIKFAHIINAKLRKKYILCNLGEIKREEQKTSGYNQIKEDFHKRRHLRWSFNNEQDLNQGRGCLNLKCLQEPHLYSYPTINGLCVCAQLFASVQFFATPWTVTHRVLCLWDSPGKNTGVGCHSLLQGLFPTQQLNPCLLRLLLWWVDSLPLNNLLLLLFSLPVMSNSLQPHSWWLKW